MNVLRKYFGIVIVVLLGMLCVSSVLIIVNELLVIKKVSELKELGLLCDNYRVCVVVKVKLYLKVNFIDLIIVYVFIVCKCELFSICQFLLLGVFKVDVVD